jgi:CubicO group peptidase (beta-lactamase class C family)
MPAILLLFVCVGASVARAEGFQWQTATPESRGLSSEKLEQLRDDLARRGTETFLVIRHDRIVFEWYAAGFGPGKPQGTASLAKAIVGGMALAVAMQDGRLKPEDRAASFVREWKEDPRKSKITIAQLATHTSGLADAEDGNNSPHDRLTGWRGEFWKLGPTDPFTISRDRTPVLFEPGERISYSNPGMAMLAYSVTAAEKQDLRSLLAQRVYGPIGITDKEWSVGYGKTFHVNGLNLIANWGGAAFTARAAARIGRLMLSGGDWDGRRILDRVVVQACIDAPGITARNKWEGDVSPRPGFGWWTNRDRAWKSLPRDAFAGAGAQHQLLLVVPSLDLIVVRNGTSLAPRETFWAAMMNHLLDPVAAAVVDPPFKPSQVIRRVRFDPPEWIVRKALDSDNWPITWGDDGHLYTAYGDGEGFEPFIDKKLSLGLARVEGEPPDFKGISLRAPTAERTGDGVKGPKASGMLMVDGILYMWVRNTANATLAWSADHGATWTWGFKLEGDTFGCPAFLNFGRNYAGAADEYVYVYSQDGPGAYEPYDNVILARVPKMKIRERGAYQFFVRLNADGSAGWTPSIGQRGRVLHYPAHCERLDAVYDAGIGRYLLTMSFGHGKGWGLFDAPHPWGPWTTAFSTPDWGLGETHDYRLPSKWISADGKRIWMVFSGRKFGGVEYDAFCARKMTLETYPPIE